MACVLSCIWLFATLRTLAHQAPLSMEFSRQEYWSRLPCTPPGYLPNPGIEPMSLLSPALAGRFFTKQNNHLYIKWNALIPRLEFMVGRNAFNEDFFHSKNVDTLSARHFVKHRKMNKMWLLLLRPWSYAGKKQTCRWEVSTRKGKNSRLCYWERDCGTGVSATLYWLKSSYNKTGGFPGSSVVKNPPANAGDMGSVPGLGRSPGGWHGNPLQYSCLDNPKDRGAWWITVHGVRVAKSRTRLSN